MAHRHGLEVQKAALCHLSDQLYNPCRQLYGCYLEVGGGYNSICDPWQSGLLVRAGAKSKGKAGEGPSGGGQEGWHIEVG